MAIPNLSLPDCELIVELARLLSVRELARKRRTTPGQISKSAKRVEETLGVKIFERSISGLTPTPAGNAIIEELRAFVSLGEKLRETTARTSPVRKPILSIGGTSFIATHLIPSVVAKAGLGPELRYRIVEFPPSDLVPAGLRGAFEIALHLDGQAWTRNWISEPVGKISWGLYARKANPLPADATQAEVRKLSFILPTYWTQEGFVVGDDSCPLPIAERLRGNEAATAETALSLVKQSNQVSFLPSILALPSIERGEVKEIHVRGWPRVENEVFATARSDRVAQRVFSAFCRETRAAIKALRASRE